MLMRSVEIRWPVVVATMALLPVIGCADRPAPPAVRPPSAQTAPAQPAAPADAAPVPSPAEQATASPSSQQPADAAANLAGLRQTLATATEENDRVDAVDDIAELGQNARGALDDLIKTTSDANIRVRWHAARAIGMIGEDAVSAMPTLIGLLADADPIVATQAAAAIGNIRSDDEIKADTPATDIAHYESATKALVGAMVHKDPRVRRAALRSIMKLKPPRELLIPLVTRQLGDADPSVVLPALNSLAGIGPAAVPMLVESLKDPKARYWAEIALAEIGPAAAPAVDALAAAAAEGDMHERMQAILTLAAIGEPAAKAGDVLRDALASSEGSLQFAAAYAAGRMRLASADEMLGKAASAEDPFLASVATWARARIKPDDKERVKDAVTKLLAGLSADNPAVRRSAISALSDLTGNLADADEAALSEGFIRLLTDADPGVQIQAGAALIRQGAVAVKPLKAALEDPDRRRAALEILTSIGVAAKDAVEPLIALLGNADPELRGEAAAVLAAIGPEAAPAVPSLQQTLASDASPAGLRYATAYALGRIGPAAKPCLDQLMKFSTSEDDFLATVAIWATLKINPGETSMFEVAIPRLRKALRSERQLVRLEAAVALGDIGPAARSAVPILELVAEDDPLPVVRDAAEEALKKIRGSVSPAS